MTLSRSTPLAAALALLAAAPAHADHPKELVGKYQMEVQEGDVLELREGGAAVMAGEETTWSASGGVLTVGTDAMAYRYDGARLVLQMGAVQLSWKRLGATLKPSPMQRAAEKAKAAAGAEPPKPQQRPDTQRPGSEAPPAAGAATADQQFRQLLLSSAWCSFTYNQHTGTSTTQRVVYRPDGVVTIGRGGETYNSGANGTVAGQSSSGSAYRWKVEGLRLFIDAADGKGFQDIGISGERNSSGYPILKALGREYSMCQ